MKKKKNAGLEINNNEKGGTKATNNQRIDKDIKSGDKKFDRYL